MKKLLFSLLVFSLLLVAGGAGATTQPLFGNTSIGYLSTGTALYWNPTGSSRSSGQGIETYASMVMPSAGTISTFYFNCSVAPGGSTAYIMTFRRSTNNGSSYADAGSPAPLSVTITGAAVSGSDLANSFPVTKGDLIEIKQTVTGTPAGSSYGMWSFVFTPTNAGETILSGNTVGNGLVTTTTEEFIALAGSSNIWSTIHATLWDNQIVMPTGGTITNLYAFVTAAPGGSGARTFAISQNGVDSSVCTAVISGAAVTANNACSGGNTVTVAAGDLITISEVGNASTPAAAKASAGFTFMPTTSGQFIMPMTNAGLALPVGGLAYVPTVGVQSGSGGATPIVKMQLPAPVAFTAKAIYVQISAAPGSSKHYPFTLYDGVSGTALTKDLTGTGSGDGITTGHYATDVAVSLGDLLCIGVNGTSGSTAASGVVSILGTTTTGANPSPSYTNGAGNYTANFSETITSAGANICYTTDNSAPTSNGNGTCTHGTQAASPASVSMTPSITELKAIATRSGYTDSAEVDAAYTWKLTTPALSVTTGTYANDQSEGITCAAGTACDNLAGTATAGTPGTCDQNTYSTPVAITATGTAVSAICTAAGFTNSDPSSATITLTAATPTATPSAGALLPGTTIALSSTTTSLTSLRYTVDGSTPSCPSTGTAYAAPFAPGAATVKAIACKTNYNASGVFSGAYTVHTAVTYYISNTATNGSVVGNDNNDGLSLSTPWLTVAYANAQTFYGGDQILFNSGGVWRETLIVPSSGYYGGQITFGSFGTGAEPIISGSNLLNTVGNWSNTSGQVWQIAATTQPNIVYFNGILGTLQSSVATVQSGGAGSWWWSSNVLYVYSASNPASAFTNPGVEAGARSWAIEINVQPYITINNLDARDGNDNTTGMIYSGSTALGLIVSNCTMERGRGYGLHLRGVASPSGAVVSNCIIANNGGAGIYLQNNLSAGLIAHDNQIYNNGWASTLDSQYYTGLQGSLGNSIIYNNIIHDNGGSYGAYGSHGIYAENGTTSTYSIYSNTIYNHIHGYGIHAFYSGTIYKNNIYSNGGGILVDGNTTNNVVYNIYYNQIWGSTSQAGIVEQNKGSGTYSVTLENNTFYNNAGAELYIGDNLTALTVKNNIFQAASGGFSYHITSAQTGTVAIDYNLAYGSSGVPCYYNSQGITWATWQGDGFDTHGVNSNPLFVSTSIPDFHLQPSSPAIGAGVAVGLTTDYIGLPLKTPPDIGAYQFDAGFDF